MASSPITSGQIDGEKMEMVTDFIFLSPKITPDCDCNQEVKRHFLLLERKTITNLDSLLKSRDISDVCILYSLYTIYFEYTVCILKAVIFPVVIDRCGSWTIKKAEHQRADAFKLCWRRLLRVPLDSKKILLANPKGNHSFPIHWKD